MNPHTVIYAIAAVVAVALLLYLLAALLKPEWFQ
jgi:K+-transporting ATPase KdpF subunit